jgi:prolyl-tRNA editing enzyme YbaK/EbsC (Cys-tRNA(Pro) deacylase)
MSGIEVGGWRVDRSVIDGDGSDDATLAGMTHAEESTHDPAGRERLVAALDPLGVPYELFPCDPALADTAAFCAAYGFAPEDSANTILVIGKSDPPRYAACVVLAPNRLDVNRTVRDRLGTRKASFAPSESTRDITGMEIGGVTVFGLPAELPIWVDARVMERERIVLGGGSRSWKVLAAPSILSTLPGAQVVEGLATDPAPPADSVPPADA